MTHITITTLEQFKAEYNNIKVNAEAGNEIKLYIAEDVLVAEGVMHRLSQLSDNVVVTNLGNKQEEEEEVETVEGVVEEVVTEEVKEETKTSRIKQFVSGVFKSQEDNKEETKMKFNIKDNKFVQGIKKAAISMWSFVKKHGVKAVGGLGAVTLGGVFGTGLGTATIVGAAIYTVGHYAYYSITTENASVRRSFASSLLYTTVGAYLAYSLFYAVAVTGLYAAQYTALGFVYTQYFILA